MPKKREKKKSLSNSTCSASSKKSTTRTKSQLACNNEISKTKQLTQKLKIQNNNRANRSRLRRLNNNEPRICGNSKPMPSLDELEKMFDDSDNDKEETKYNEDISQEITKNNNYNLTKYPVSLTPPIETSNEINKLELYSPSTIQAIVDRVTESVNNLAKNIPPPPINPPKKHKKPLMPYIVGCENRPQVPSRPTTNFCKGVYINTYGDESNSSDDEDPPAKRANRTKAVYFSKSRFNAKSDEIAACLKEYDSLSDKSYDSDKTVAYDFQSSAWPQSFSPEPSTSKCYNVIKKNEISLNESLIAATQCNENHIKSIPLTYLIGNNCLNAQCNEDKHHMLPVTASKENISLTTIINNGNQNVIKTNAIAEQCNKGNEILSAKEPNESNCFTAEKYKDDSEIITIMESSETLTTTRSSIDNDRKIEIIEQPVEVIDVEEYIESKYNKKRLNNNNVDIQVIDDNIEIIQPTVQKFDSTIIIDDCYSSLDLNQTSDDDIVIVDVDDVIAESTAIVEKYRQTNNFGTVTIAKPTLSRIITPTTDTSLHNGVIAGTVPMSNTGTAVAGSVLETNHSNHNLPVTNNNPKKSDSYKFLPIPQVNDMVNFIKTHFISMFEKRDPKNISDDYILTNNNMTQTQQKSILTDKAMTNTNVVQSPQESTLSHNSIILSDNPVTHRNVAHSPQQMMQSNNPDTPKSIGECPICMDNLTNKTVASTICGHIFCMNCIESAMKMNGKKCPKCRKVLRKNGYHPIFL